MKEVQMIIKTCNNCKYYKWETPWNKNTCDNMKSRYRGQSLGQHPDYKCCTNWEKKNDN